MAISTDLFNRKECKMEAEKRKIYTDLMEQIRGEIINYPLYRCDIAFNRGVKAALAIIESRIDD